nr:hypothetical protein [Nanoarchaeota archaeon]
MPAHPIEAAKRVGGTFLENTVKALLDGAESKVEIECSELIGIKVPSDCYRYCIHPKCSYYKKMSEKDKAYFSQT